MSMTDRQQKVVIDCLLFIVFHNKDFTACKARAISALSALDLTPFDVTESTVR